MGILSRFKDIMSSNIQALLDKSDDPEKTIADYLRTLNSDLGKIKAEMASIKAEERRAKRARDECQDEIDKLQRYAERAVAAGDDRDAVKFLERKAVQAEKLPRLQNLLEIATSHVSQMEQMQQKLSSEIGQLEARYAQLKGKLAAARTQQKRNERASALNGVDAAFTALEAKANQAYDEAQALAELRQEEKDDLDELLAPFERTEETRTPEQELADLKEKIQKGE